MSLTMILMAVGGFLLAVLGALIGHPLSKSAGRKEGAEQAAKQQEIIQAKETVKAVQERAHVEAEVSSLADAELDARLQRHDRAD